MLLTLDLPPARGRSSVNESKPWPFCVVSMNFALPDSGGIGAGGPQHCTKPVPLAGVHTFRDSTRKTRECSQRLAPTEKPAESNANPLSSCISSRRGSYFSQKHQKLDGERSPFLLLLLLSNIRRALLYRPGADSCQPTGGRFKIYTKNTKLHKINQYILS